MNGKKTKKELAAEVESLRARVKRLQKGTRRKSSGDHDLTVREAFPTIIAAITMPLFVKNADYKFTLLNKGFCNLLGYSNAELLGKSDCDIFPPGEADAFRTSDDLVMQSGTGSTSEMTMTDSAGFVHDVVINKILYCNLKNEKFIVGIVYDVTEQKRLEEDVKASEFRYRSLVHTMNEAVAVHEMIYDASGKPVDYRIIEVNDAFARHTGISTIPKNVLASIFYRMARPPYLETYARVAETAARTFFEASFEPLNKDFAISVFSPQRGLFVTVFTDITERNRTLKALAESERFMRSVLDSLGSRICVLNETGIVLSVNKAWKNAQTQERLFSINAGEGENYLARCDSVIGKNAGDAAALASGIRSVMHGEQKTIALEYACHSESGSAVGWFFARVSRCEGAGPVRVVVSHLNITERKQAENALRASMEQLHLLGNRLESIQEEERKSVSREVHDELGQVLTALKMDLITLKRSGINDAALFEQRIHSTLELTDSAIKTVQNISSRLRPSVLDDLGLLAAIEWQAEEFQKRSGIICALHLPTVEPAQENECSTTLFRILQEALTNVARHAQATHVDVRLDVSEQSCALSVIDNGIGILPERVNDPASLGLMGIRERLRPHNGSFDIHNVLSGGTEVIVRLPRAEKK